MIKNSQKIIATLTPDFKTWTAARLLYLVAGIMLVTQAIYEAQYLGLAIGGYFMAMAIFKFGCAAGNCNYTYTQRQTPAVNTIPTEEQDTKHNQQ